MNVKLGNITQSRQPMQIPTHFKDKIEQAEHHSAQLVDVEVSIYPLLLNMETQISSDNQAKNKTTIAAVLLPSLFLGRNNERQHPDDVADNVYQPKRERSPVSIALRRDCLEFIQSRWSAPLRRVTMHSFIIKASTVANFVEAVFC